MMQVRYQRRVTQQTSGAAQPVEGAYGSSVYREQANFGNAVKNIGLDVMDRAIELKQKENQAAVRDMINQARESDREFMMTLTAKKGKDGIVAYNEAKSYFDERRRDLSEGITSPQQQEMFYQSYENLVNSNLETAAAHQARQIELYDTQTREANIEQSYNDAIASRGNPELSKAYMIAGERETEALYSHLGDDVVKEKKALFRSNVHAAKIDALAEEDPERAQQYYENHKDEILGAAQVKIEKVVMKEAKAKAVYDGPGFSSLPYEEQLEVVKGIEDEDVQNAVASVVSQRRNIQEAQRTEQQYQTYQDAWDLAMDQEIARGEIMKLDLEPSQKEHLISVITQEEGDKPNSPENLVKWYQARQKILAGEWDESRVMQAALNGEIYAGHTKELIGLVSTAREAPSLGRAEAVLRERYADIYSDEEDKAKYTDLLNKDIMEFRKVNSREPSYGEILEIGDRIAKPDIEKRWYHRIPFVSDPKGRFEKDSPEGLYDSLANDIRMAGDWPDTYWDSESNVFVLGERGGYLYVQTPDGTQLKRKMAE